MRVIGSFIVTLVAPLSRVAAVALVAPLALVACSPAAATPSATTAAPASTPSNVGVPTPATGTPTLFLPGLVSTADDDAHVTVAPDGRTLYFVLGPPAVNWFAICESRLTGGRWGKPEIASFSGQYRDADMFFTADGATAFFVSNRPRPGGAPREDTDIFTMRRTKDGWSTPEVVSAISSDGNEWFPTVTDDGTIYFGSERREGNLGPEGTSDLWRAKRTDHGYGPPENLGPAINTPGKDIEAFVARDESYILFSSSGRKDTRGAYDLYVSYRRAGQTPEWTEPVNLGEPINSSEWEYGAKPSPDGKTLYFTSKRGFPDKPQPGRITYDELASRMHGPGNGLGDVYQVDLRAHPLPPPPR